MTDLVLVPDNHYILAAVERVRDYMHDAKAPNTRRAYRAGWNDFTAWCEARSVSSLPAQPDTVAVYVAECASRLKVSTIQLRLAAISQAHKATGNETPTTSSVVKLTMQGIRRQHGTAQRQVTAATTPVMRALVASCAPNPVGGPRDRALLLIGFAGAFRRSELVSLNVADVVEEDDGLRIRLRRSKTDQDGQGATKGIPFGSNPDTCPVRAWRAWMAVCGFTDGPAFRGVDRHGNVSQQRLSGKAVALIIKRAATRAGLPADDYSGHSLRAGLCTAAAEAGVAERDIMRQSGTGRC